MKAVPGSNQFWTRVVPVVVLVYLVWDWLWLPIRFFNQMAFFLFVGIICNFLFKLSPPKNPPTDWQGVAVGHRGVRLELNSGIPENTIESLTYAFDNGAEAVEIDVILTKDNIPVVIHDDNINRLLEGEGFVSQMTFEELRKFPYRHASPTVQIPTLDDVLELIKSRGKKILVEIKPVPQGTDILCKQVAEKLKKYDLVYKSVVISFNPIALYLVRTMDPEIRTCLLFKHDMISTIAKSPKFAITIPSFLSPVTAVLDWILYTSCTTFLPGFLGCSMVGPCVDYVSQHYMDAWIESGYVVYIWVVNEKHRRDHLLERKASVAFDFFN